MVGGEILDQIINHCATWFEGLEREAGIKDKKDSQEFTLNSGDAYEWAERVLRGVNLSEATRQTIEDFMVALPRVFKDRIKFGEGHNIPEKIYPNIGFYISALCAKIPLQRYSLPTHKLYEELNFAPDYLFYKFEPKEIPEVVIDGPVRDNCFFQAQVVAYVRGNAGYRNARGFVKGLIKFMESTGNNTAEFIAGGHVQMKEGGKNIGLGGTGGIIEVDKAGDNLGKLIDGTSIFVYHKAGANLGEGMKLGHVQFGRPEDQVRALEEDRILAKLEAEIQATQDTELKAKLGDELKQVQDSLKYDLGADAGKDMKGGRIRLFKRYNGMLPPQGKTGGIFEPYNDRSI